MRSGLVAQALQYVCRFLSGYVVFRHPREPERTQDIQVFQQGRVGVQPVPYAERVCGEHDGLAWGQRTAETLELLEKRHYFLLSLRPHFRCLFPVVEASSGFFRHIEAVEGFVVAVSFPDLPGCLFVPLEGFFREVEPCIQTDPGEHMHAESVRLGEYGLYRVLCRNLYPSSVKSGVIICLPRIGVCRHCVFPDVFLVPEKLLDDDYIHSEPVHRPDHHPPVLVRQFPYVVVPVFPLYFAPVAYPDKGPSCFLRGTGAGMYY